MVRISISTWPVLKAQRLLLLDGGSGQHENIRRFYIGFLSARQPTRIVTAQTGEIAQNKGVTLCPQKLIKSSRFIVWSKKFEPLTPSTNLDAFFRAKFIFANLWFQNDIPNLERHQKLLSNWKLSSRIDDDGGQELKQAILLMVQKSCTN